MDVCVQFNSAIDSPIVAMQTIADEQHYNVKSLLSLQPKVQRKILSYLSISELMRLRSVSKKLNKLVNFVLQNRMQFTLSFQEFFDKPRITSKALSKLKLFGSTPIFRFMYGNVNNTNKNFQTIPLHSLETLITTTANSSFFNAWKIRASQFPEFVQFLEAHGLTQKLIRLVIIDVKESCIFPKILFSKDTILHLNLQTLILSSPVDFKRPLIEDTDVATVLKSDLKIIRLEGDFILKWPKTAISMIRSSRKLRKLMFQDVVLFLQHHCSLLEKIFSMLTYQLHPVTSMLHEFGWKVEIENGKKYPELLDIVADMKLPKIKKLYLGSSRLKVENKNRMPGLHRIFWNIPTSLREIYIDGELQISFKGDENNQNGSSDEGDIEDELRKDRQKSMEDFAVLSDILKRSLSLISEKEKARKKSAELKQQPSSSKNIDDTFMSGDFNYVMSMSTAAMEDDIMPAIIDASRGNVMPQAYETDDAILYEDSELMEDDEEGSFEEDDDSENDVNIADANTEGSDTTPDRNSSPYYNFELPSSKEKQHRNAYDHQTTFRKFMLPPNRIEKLFIRSACGYQLDIFNLIDQMPRLKTLEITNPTGFQMGGEIPYLQKTEFNSKPHASINTFKLIGQYINLKNDLTEIIAKLPNLRRFKITVGGFCPQDEITEFHVTSMEKACSEVVKLLLVEELDFKVGFCVQPHDFKRGMEFLAGMSKLRKLTTTWEFPSDYGVEDIANALLPFARKEITIEVLWKSVRDSRKPNVIQGFARKNHINLALKWTMWDKRNDVAELEL